MPRAYAADAGQAMRSGDCGQPGDGRYHPGMARYTILASAGELGPGDWIATVSGVAPEVERPTVLRASTATKAEAERRRDELVTHLATSLRAAGHEVVGLVE